MKSIRTSASLAFLTGAAALALAGCNSKTAVAASPAEPVYHDLTSYYQALPAVDNVSLSEVQAATLAAYPISCLDRLQSGGRGGGGGGAPEEAPTNASAVGTAAPVTPPTPIPYLWIPAGPSTLLANYANTRAFFGCNTWHDAVASTWTLVVALKRYPDSPMAKLIRERLADHLAPRSLQGEIAYFQGARTFERPYGQAWAMKLYMELATWNDADGKKWADGLKPLVTSFAQQMPTFLNDMPDAVRTPNTANTAPSLRLLAAYADFASDAALRDAVNKNAKRLYQDDADCPVGYEQDSTAVISPCLDEAALMATVLDKAAYPGWLDKFLPAAYSRAFQVVAHPVEVSVIAKMPTNNVKANAVGLQFNRAEELLTIAAALPPQDPRFNVFRRVAAVDAAGGLKAMGTYGYTGPQWIAAAAMQYELANSPVPVAPTRVAASTPPGAAQ